MNMKNIFRLISLVLSLALAAIPASAQYPTKPVRLIVPFAAGGPTDTVARIVGQALSKSIGQAVVIENRPGADGVIAAQALVSAPADGYTLLFAASSMVALPLVNKPAPFDPVTEFAPVSLVGRFAFCMYVHPSVPARSVAEFIKYARANGGTLSYASSNLNEFMAASRFMKAAAISMLRVPYKGAAQAMPDLIAGRIQVNFAPISAGLPYVKDGRLRILASLLAERSPATPEVPTMTEAGLPAISVPTWQAIFGPAKTPGEILDRLSREVNLILQGSDVRAQLERQVLHVEGSTPPALSAIVREDMRAWGQFIRENGLAPE
jgi:tripartite-type tricarboxylate transporter receptor subunit TctC